MSRGMRFVAFVCVPAVTWLLGWELPVGWILTRCEKDPYLGSPHLFAFTEARTGDMRMCVALFERWESQMSALEGVQRSI